MDGDEKDQWEYQTPQAGQHSDWSYESAPPQESGTERFLHHAGVPTSFGELYQAGKNLILPEESPTSPSAFHLQKLPIVGPMIRAQRETFDQPDIWGKVYGSIPFVGPAGYAMGKDIGASDWPAVAGDAANIVTQAFGAKGVRPQLAAGIRTAGEGIEAAAPKVAKGASVAGAGYGTLKSLEHGNLPGAGISLYTRPHVERLLTKVGTGLGRGMQRLGNVMEPNIPTSFGTAAASRFLRAPGIEGEDVGPLPREGEDRSAASLGPFPTPGVSPLDRPFVAPAPYRLRGAELTEPTTVTPRRVLGPERQLPPARPEPQPQGEVAPTPLKAKTVAGQNAEILRKSGIAGPRATQQPLTEIPSGDLEPDPKLTFKNSRSGEDAITEQIRSHSLNKLRAIATQRGLEVKPSDTNDMLIKKISASATPKEIEAFDQARVERIQPNYGAARNGRPAPAAPVIRMPERTAAPEQAAPAPAPIVLNNETNLEEALKTALQNRQSAAAVEPTVPKIGEPGVSPKGRGIARESQSEAARTFPHLGEEIPKADPLPESGQYAAVRTDDGQVFADPNWQRSTHILFARDRGIPPDRIADAGWVKDGVYDPAERSDATAYGERARATLRSQAKRVEVTPPQEPAPAPAPTKPARAKVTRQPKPAEEPIKEFDQAVESTGAEVKAGQPSKQFAAKIDKATELKPENDAELKTKHTGAAYQREYFKAALQQAKDAWDETLKDVPEAEFGKPATYSGRKEIKAYLKGGELGDRLTLRESNYGGSDGWDVVYETYITPKEKLSRGIAEKPKPSVPVLGRQKIAEKLPLATAKKVAEARLRSGQLFNPDEPFMNSSYGQEINGKPSEELKTRTPEGIKSAQLYIKVPGDGHFLINNNAAAIEKALKGADEGFTPPKASAERGPRIPKSPKEFDNEKYITGLEKEIADLEDKVNKRFGDTSHYQEELKAARENLAEAKSSK